MRWWRALLLGMLATCSRVSGEAIPCATADECPGVRTNACGARTCNAGFCDQDLEPRFTAIGPQLPGNCLVVGCDGAGELKSLAFSDDLPIDGEPCTQDLCNDGLSKNPPEPKGTKCGKDLNLSCNDSGKCVGCETAGDCGDDAACYHWTCTPPTEPEGKGTCDKVDVLVGQASAEDVAGDCQSDICNGNGQPFTLPAADGTACATGCCMGGACVASGACPDPTGTGGNTSAVSGVGGSGLAPSGSGGDPNTSSSGAGATGAGASGPGPGPGAGPSSGGSPPTDPCGGCPNGWACVDGNCCYCPNGPEELCIC